MFINVDCRKELIIYLCFIISHCIPKFLEIYIKKDNSRSLKSFSHISLIIFLKYSKFFEKKVNNRINISKKKKIIFLSQNTIIFILIICSILYELMSSKVVLNDKIRHFSYYGDIIMFIVLEKIILKRTVYSHQMISFIFYFIVILYLILIQFNSIDFFFIFLFKFILNCYTFVFSILIIKFLNTKYFVNIFLLGSIIGITRYCYQTIKKGYKFDFNFPDLFILILNILYYFSRLLYYYLYYYILENFNSIFIFICDSFLLLFFKIFPLNSKDKDVFNYHFDNEMEKLELTFITLITILSGLIYSEIIELNFLGFNKNLRKVIGKRGDNELLNLKKEESIQDDSLSMSIFS